MKKFQRIGALVLALIMCLSLGIVVSASSTATPIPPVPSGAVSLTINKYLWTGTGEPVLDYPGTGSEDDIDEVESGFTPHADVVFKVEVVDVETKKDGLGNPITYWSTVYVKTNSDGIAKVKAKEKYYLSEADAKNGENELTFGEIFYGNYKVTEIKASTFSAVNLTSNVSLPMVNPSEEVDAPYWLNDVHIFPKNLPEDRDVTIEKDALDSNGAPYADGVVPYYSDKSEIDWSIVVNIPETIADAESYVITDMFPEVKDDSANLLLQAFALKGNLSFYKLFGEEAPVELTLAKCAGETEHALEGHVCGDYRLIPVKKTIGVVEDTVGFKVEFTETGLNKLAAIRAGDLVNPDNLLEGELIDDAIFTEIQIRYTTNFIIPYAAGGADAGKRKHYVDFALKNEVKASYTDELGEKTKEDDAEIKTGGLQILKQDAASKVALIGVTFGIYKADPSIVTENNDAIATIITDGDGKASYEGLEIEDATNGDKYYLKESTPPTGYEANNGKIFEVTVKQGEYASANIFTILNPKGFELPITGGTGTIMFTIGGILLIGLAVVFLLVSRKKKANNA